MKMRHSMLFLAAALAVGLSACGGAASSTASSAAAAPSSSAAMSSELRPIDEFDTPGTVRPAEEYTAKDLMENSVTWPASFETTAAKDVDGHYVLDATYYAYDFYDKEKIEALQSGDKLLAHDTDAKLQEVVIKTIEIADGYVTINGGIDEGGMELKEENGWYRTLTMDDHPVYYEVQELSLWLSPDVVLNDSSADFEAEAVTTTGDDAVAAAIAADETGAGFSCYNTRLTVQKGEITQIDRVWIP